MPLNLSPLDLVQLFAEALVAVCLALYMTEQLAQQSIKRDLDEHPSSANAEPPGAAELLSRELDPLTSRLWRGWQALFGPSTVLDEWPVVMRWLVHAVVLPFYSVAALVLLIVALPVALGRFAVRRGTDWRLRIVALAGTVAAALEAWEWAALGDQLGTWLRGG